VSGTDAGVHVIALIMIGVSVVAVAITVLDRRLVTQTVSARRA
jgi:hypothetical protein